MERIRQIVAANMKAARERANLSQAKLAELCGVSTTLIAEVETCRKWPSPRSLEAISKGLSLKPYELFLDDPAASIEAELYDSIASRIKKAIDVESARIAKKKF